MSVTVVTRWTTPNVDESTKAARESKAIWMKNGAENFRLSQVFTGEFTGQWLVAVTFADMATYAKSQAAVSGSADMKKVQASNGKAGAVMQERIILIGTDL